MLKSISYLRYLGILALLLTYIVNTGCSSSSDSGSEITVQSIEISNGVSSIALNSKLPLIATAFLSNGDKSDYTSQVTWSSSNTSVATIAADGTITAVSTGTVTITAKYQDITVSATLTVNSAQLTALSISPQNKKILVSQKLTMTATGIYDNGSKQDLSSQVSWSSSDSTIASLSKNIATGVKSGAVDITATLGDKTTSTTLTIADPSLTSLQLNIPDKTLIEGTAININANGLYNDGKIYDLTDKVTWTSSNSAVATFNQNKLSLLTAGTVEITASQGAISSKRTLTIETASLESIVIDPATLNIHAGEISQLQAQGFYNNGKSNNITNKVHWSVDSATVGVVSNSAQQEGKLTALTTGALVITASLNNITATKSVSVSPALLERITINYESSSLAKGTTQNLTATGIYSDDTFRDITQDVIWQSSNTTIASIENAGENSGLLHGIDKGSATISATFGSVSSSISIIVTDSLLTSITLENIGGTIYPGTKLNARAIGIFKDGSSQIITDLVSWYSETSTVAEVSNSVGSQGQITALSIGNTSIVATLNNVSASASLSVAAITLQEIIIDADATEIAKGTRTQLHATGVYSNNTTRDISDSVSWKSSDSTGIHVSNVQSNIGEVSGLITGAYQITAQLDGKSASVDISVTAATLSSLEISPAKVTIVKNTSTNLIATGVFSDNSRQDLSLQVLWQSSNNSIASITTGINHNIRVNGIAEGSATVSASLDNKTATVSVTVSTNTLQSINLIADDGGAAIAAGFNKTLIAIGTFSDNSTQDITDQISWKTIDSSICNFTDSVEQPGVIVGLKKGSCQVTASMQNKSGNIIFEVTDATLSSIALTPASSTIAKGSVITFIAKGTYSDASVSTISSQVTWKTADSTISVSNLKGSKGKVTALNEGSGTVQVELNGVTASANITVTSAVLSSIAISTEFPDIYKGTNVLFMAEGTYSDASQQDVSNQVIWSSSNESIALISNADSTRGVLYALQEGDVTITAKLNDVTQTIDISVVNDPAVPASLSLSTNPKVILNNGIESMTLTINVSAVDNTITVPDGTTVDVNIIFGAGTLSSQSVTTTSGQAILTFTSTVKGITVIKASIPGTTITNSVTVYSTDNFNETIASTKFYNATFDSNGNITAGSIFGFGCTNLSDHTFNLNDIVVSNNDGILYTASTETDPNKNHLGDHLLSGGETAGLVYGTDDAVHNSIVIKCLLSDPATAEEIVITGDFTLTVIAKPR